MKVKLEKSEFLPCLRTAYRAVPQKTTTPILENVLLKADGGMLYITGCNEGLSVQVACPCTDGVDGIAAVPAKLLLEIASSIPDGAFSLSIVDGSACTVDWGAGYSTIPVFNAAYFPDLALPDDLEMQYIGQSFGVALKKALPHVLADGLRPILGGVLINPIMGGALNVVATDSHTLAIIPLNGDIKRPCVIPAKAVAIIADAMGDAVGVKVGICDKGIVFSVNDTIIVTREVLGKFPEYSRIIPVDADKTLIVDTHEFISALKRISVCADNASKCVIMNLDALNGVLIEATSYGAGTSAKEQVNGAQYDGEDMRIGFKSDFLLRILSTISEGKTKFQFAASNRAALVSSDGNDAKFIIMPIQVK